MRKVEEDTSATWSIYSPHTESERNWGPVKWRNEYAYTQWIGQNEWAYMDGNWRGTRNPTIEEVAAIDGETHRLDCWRFSEYTYVEILTYKPKYAEFLADE